MAVRGNLKNVWRFWWQLLICCSCSCSNCCVNNRHYITKRIGGRKGAHGCDRCYVVSRRSARATCSCPNCEQRTHGCMLISQKCRQLNSIFCCVRSESRSKAGCNGACNGSGRWRRPIPPPGRVTYWSRVQAGLRDWLQQFQLMNISVHAQKYANEPKIVYDGIYFILLQCYRSDVRTSAIQ